MKNYRWFYKNKPGFTLIEACLGLVIISIIIALLNFANPILHKHPILNNPVNLTWQNMISTLEESSNPFEWIEILNDGNNLKLTRLTNKNQVSKEYILKVTKVTHTLYVNGIERGYMPVIYNVRQVMFQERHQRIWIKVIYINGDSNEAYLAINKRKA